MIIDEKLINKKIEELEAQMSLADFWENKDRAQNAVRDLNELKGKLEEVKAIERGDAILTILSGAGGDDAEDW